MLAMLVRGSFICKPEGAVLRRVAALIAILISSNTPVTTAASAATDPDKYCAFFDTAARDLSRRVGSRIDKWTELEKVESNCAERTIVFHQRLIAPSDVLKVGWKELMALRWSKHYCSPDSPFADAILAHHWTIVTTIATRDGTTSSISAECRFPEV